jgi:hypothetical protein
MEHYSSQTVSASKWCGKCGKFTQHRVDDHRATVCLECVAKLEALHASKSPPELARQQNLFSVGIDL